MRVTLFAAASLGNSVWGAWRGYGDFGLRAVQERGAAVALSDELPAQVDDTAELVEQACNAPSKPRKTYTWTCQYCGQPFTTTHYGRRYCSNAHKQAAYRERRR